MGGGLQREGSPQGLREGLGSPRVGGLQLGGSPRSSGSPRVGGLSQGSPSSEGWGSGIGVPHGWGGGSSAPKGGGTPWVGGLGSPPSPTEGEIGVP